MVVCLDSQSQQWGETDLWMPALGLDWNDRVEVVDELSGEVYQWGQRNAVGLDPHWRAAHILTAGQQRRDTEPTTSTDRREDRRVSMTYTDDQGIVHEPQASDYRRARPIAGGDTDREWYKRAVFYEVLVRAFADSNGDGTGDLRGLIDKLDYLSWLGVDCLWLPPFYDSPLRDGGYDIADYRKVLPEFGTVEDFVALLDAAHERGIRVIVDLVMNHTSDAHQWFQESRRHPDGPVRRLLRLARRRHRLSRTPGSSSSTPSPATGPSTRCGSSISGTGSSPTSPT